MRDQSIAVIIPFYGKWPSYFNLFLKSAAYNPLLDIIFITDLDLPDYVTPNIKKVHIKFDDLVSDIAKKLERPVALNSYYKLCDFKPLYGFLFQDHVKEYDFWAFGDIDLIYGKVDQFITDELLKNYDVITFRKDWLSGALTLFRNKTQINELFRESPDWEKVVTEKKHFSFTECATQYGEVMRTGSIFNVQMEIVPMTVVVKKAALENRIRLFEEKLIKESIVNNDFVRFNKGNVTDNRNNNFLHYHYVTEKNKDTFSYPGWEKAPDMFYVTRFGFFHSMDSPVTHLVRLFRLLKSNRKKLGQKIYGIYKPASKEVKAKNDH